MQFTLIIITIYFLTGAFAINRINHKHPEKRKENILKYITYLLLVTGMIACIQNFLLPYICFIIIYIGLYEIIKAGTNQKSFSLKTISVSILLYLLITIPFFLFSSKVQMTEQLFIYIIVFVFDGFCQITGQLAGRNKLARRISPGKTVEGLAGGLTAALVTGIAINPIVGFPIPALLIITLLICISSLAGDLLASFYKRKTGIKDYGNIIPGHGGILDRYDSFIMAGGCYYLITLFYKTLPISLS
ncbi:MAG: phosphatidate cytidylyltransferase [Bacteroidota bacterium]